MVIFFFAITPEFKCFYVRPQVSIDYTCNCTYNRAMNPNKTFQVEKKHNCSRQDPQRSIDFSALKDWHAIERAIVRLLTRRKNPMREREICHWFQATPDAYIHIALTQLCGRGEVDGSWTSMRRRGVLEYSIPEER